MGEDAGDAGDHTCRWRVLGAQQLGALANDARMGGLINPVRTIVLIRCEICQIPSTITLAGHWTTQDMQLAVPA
jgi:hypothetical protein